MELQIVERDSGAIRQQYSPKKEGAARTDCSVMIISL